MNNRLRQLIQLKTDGNQAEFATIMGWKPQYLYRLLKGEGGIGIRPVVALLEKFPELNARWLLLGEGNMVSSGVDQAKAHLLRLLSLEKYMPVMTVEQLRQMTEEGRTDFPTATIANWEELLRRREEFMSNSIKRSTICNPPTANKS